jgi:small subunit ribosomal protein S4
LGDPKYPRRMWKKPKRPLNYDLKMEELKTLGTFGLKTKRELWKAHTQLSKVRHQARSLLALGKEIREKKEPILMNSLTRIGLVSENSTLDDVLNLQITDLLSRRLQTVVQKKLSFKTPYQARQAVVHGHVMIGDRIINIPSYTVKVNEEKEIHLTSDSSLKDLLAQKEEPEIDVKTSEQPEVESTTEPKVESTTEPKVESTTEPKVESTTEQPEVEKTSTEISQD